MLISCGVEIFHETSRDLQGSAARSTQRRHCAARLPQTEQERIRMFSAMHEWDLEAVISREPAGPPGRTDPAAAGTAVHTYTCTWEWPPAIRGKALVCSDGGRLDRAMPGFDRAWAEAKYQVRGAARTPRPEAYAL